MMISVIKIVLNSQEILFFLFLIIFIASFQYVLHRTQGKGKLEGKKGSNKRTTSGHQKKTAENT